MLKIPVIRTDRLLGRREARSGGLLRGRIDAWGEPGKQSMDERERIDSAASQSDAIPSNEVARIRPRHSPATPQEPSSDPVRVLARMPNLESEPAAAGRGSRRSQRRRRDRGRILSAPVAVPLLVGAGVLLVAAAVLPLILGSRKPADRHDPGDPPPKAMAAADADSHTPAEGPDIASAALPWSDSTEPVDGPADPSCRDLPIVASWQDPGQWPYGSDAGQPEAAHSGAPGQYPQTHGATAIQTYPEAVAKTAAREGEAAQASRPAQVSYEDYAAPRAGMNESMALNSSGSPLPQAHGTGADYAGGRQPTSAYPETRPTAGIPIVGSPIVGSPIVGSPIVGSPIPGSFRAGSGSVGHYRDQTYARPQGPGVARLQGVIEKPSVRTTYDYTRPGVY